MVIKKGQVWWIDLESPSGSEPGYRRPAVVISADSFNRSTINTVICAVITSTLRLKDVPGNIFLKKEESRLKKESVINISQIVTLDKESLAEFVTQLKPQTVKEIYEGLHLVLDLPLH